MKIQNIILYITVNNCALSRKCLNIVKKYDIDRYIIIKDVNSLLRNKEKIPKALKYVPTLFVIMIDNKGQRYIDIAEKTDAIGYLIDFFEVDEKIIDNGNKLSKQDRFLQEYYKKEGEKVNSITTGENKKQKSDNPHNSVLNFIENENNNILNNKKKSLKPPNNKPYNGEDALYISTLEKKQYQVDKEIKGKKGHSRDRIGVIGEKNNAIMGLIEKNGKGEIIVSDEKKNKKTTPIYS